jgi:hypothetical protein
MSVPFTARHAHAGANVMLLRLLDATFGVAEHMTSVYQSALPPGTRFVKVDLDSELTVQRVGRKWKFGRDDGTSVEHSL